MDNYLGELPSELIFEIIKYFDTSDKDRLYKDINNLSKLVGPNIFESIFRLEYPKLYIQIRDVIKDDKYLQTKIPCEWAELYSQFRYIYTGTHKHNQMGTYINSATGMVRKCVSNVVTFDLHYIFKYRDIDMVRQLKIKHHHILYRILFKQKYPAEYAKLNKLERCDLNESYGTFIKIHNSEHGYKLIGLDWDTLHLLYTDKVAFKSLFDSKPTSVKSFIYDLSYQDRSAEVLGTIVENSDNKSYIFDNTDFYCMEGLISMRKNELVKLMYPHLTSDKFTIKEYLIICMDDKNLELFEWFLNQDNDFSVGNHLFHGRVLYMLSVNSNISSQSILEYKEYLALLSKKLGQNYVKFLYEYTK